jgi:radical SAM superfamily enzyme YgiQ (UPF0313 family)
MPFNFLFVNPPIYDFTAYDFWLKPYGLLRVAGALEGNKIYYFNFLGEKYKKKIKDDGRGKFFKTRVQKPEMFSDIPKPYFRYGATKEEFESFIKGIKNLDAVFITSSMTYWCNGVKEVIEQVRRNHKNAKIFLGGIYATLMFEHAKNLEVDLVVKGSDLTPLENILGIKLKEKLADWSLEKGSGSGVIAISRGCPFSCSYCAIKEIEKGFSFRDEILIEKEFQSLFFAKIRNVAFYDDALLYNFDKGLGNILNIVKGRNFLFHTPNGLNAKFLTKEVARRLKEANFKNLFLSLESVDDNFLEESGNKVNKDDFLNALENLLSSGFGKESISAYLLLGHPDIEEESIKDSILFLKKLGIKIHLAEFSPIPETRDSYKCEKYGSLKEPLNHNKVAFSIRVLGLKKYQELKSFAKLKE